VEQKDLKGMKRNSFTVTRPIQMTKKYSRLFWLVYCATQCFSLYLCTKACDDD